MLANRSPVPSGVPKRGEFAADDPQDGPLEYVVGGRFIDTLLDYNDDEEEEEAGGGGEGEGRRRRS
jgi:hypothetical protein